MEKKVLWKRIKQYKIAYLFLLPALIHYSIFGLYPILSGLRLAFFNWDGMSPTMEFVGLRNLINAFGDLRLWQGISHNVFITAVLVVFRVSLGLGLAIILESIWKKLQDITKTILFIPTVISMVVVAIIFKMFFEPNFGKVNLFFQQIGLGSLARVWLTEISPILWIGNLALLVIAAVMVWKTYGMTMVIYHAALIGLPPEIYDAAKVDGARGWSLFRSITWPLLWPITSMLIILSIITSMQVFDIVFVMTGGGPFRKTETIAVYIIERTFISTGVTGMAPNYGYAVAMSLVLFSIIAAITIINLKVLRKRR